MKRILLIFTLFIAAYSVRGQDAYINSIGLRGGPLLGVSYKHFVWPVSGVIEGIAGFNFLNGRYTSLTGLYEHHLFINYQTNFFGGAGTTLGLNKTDFIWQLDAIVGIEYLLDTFPLLISLDYKPGYKILDNELVFNEFALSIRYIITD